MSDSRPRALIIGAGIGGLATAVALQRAGIEVAVFERTAELREVGAGLAVWANAVKALQQLGVAETLVAAGIPIHDYQFRSSSGETLIQVSVDDLTRRVAAPSVVLRRTDVQRTLYEALDAGVMQLGANCIGFDTDDRGVIAHFSNGREERGALLIGADGIKSVTRATQFGENKFRYSGYKCWRAITPFTHASFPPGSWWLFWGRGARFGMSQVGEGAVYWYAMVNATEGSSEQEVGRKRLVLETFKDWATPIEALLEATEESTILANDLYDMAPLNQWGDGPVTLLGDAAHPTTPNMGQGACQAIEDAVILAKDLALTRGLRDHGAAVNALRTYENRRMSRAARVTNLSWRIGAVGQWENPIACTIRNAALKALPNALMRKSLESNLAYDA